MLRKLINGVKNYSEIFTKISDNKRNFVLKNASLQLENMLVSKISKNKEIF